jgi:predicted nucleotidyltransferase
MTDTTRPATIEELRARLAALLPEFRGRYPIRTVGIFGSWARGEQTAHSDVDLLVEFGAPVGLFAVVALEEELSARLGISVDLVTPAALKPRISERVHRELLTA